MRTTLLSSTAIIGLMLAACGDETKNTTPPTSGTAPSHVTPSPGETTDGRTTTATTDANNVAADNTGRNKRDDGTTLTPVDQGTSERDIAITTAVRKAVVAHKGLSVSAQNVKIIALDGTVTLRGPVASEAERDTIVEIAKQVPDVHTVMNKLEVASQ